MVDPVVAMLAAAALAAAIFTLSGRVYAAASAQESTSEPIIIEAETTQYEYGSKGTIVVATGNVKATGGGLSLSADYLRVDVDAGDLLARGNVEVRRGASVTRCDLFAYNLETRTGRVLEPEAEVPGVRARGKEMDVQPDRLALADAHATGCDLAEPCYRVTSRRLVIYPDKRVVAEWPVLWLETVPVLALPRLTIPVRGERVGWVEGEGYPVPRLSYDPENGFVAGLSYLDRSREGLAIRYEGAYLTARRGVQAQARAEILLGPGQTASLTGGFRSWEGAYGSGEWKLGLSSGISIEADARYNAEPAMPGSESASDAPPGSGLEGGITLRADAGLIGAELAARKDVYSSGVVYSLPAVEVSSGLVRVPGAPLTLSLAGGAARFEEPGRGLLSTRAFVTVAASTIPLRLAQGITCNASVEARRAWYGTGDLLDTRTARIGLDGKFGKVEAFGASVPRVSANLVYLRRMVSGATPFAFDSASPAQQATAEIALRVSEGWTVKAGGVYDLEAREATDVDFSIVNHHHCYDVRATWREKRKVFGLEVRFTR